jgi:predicted transglutaminase-like cysteine proteinase
MISGLHRATAFRRRSLVAAAFRAVAALACLASGAAWATDAQHAYPKLFGTNETRSDSIKTFPKWTDMLTRHHAEEKRGDPACVPTRFSRCSVADWLTFLEGEKRKDRPTQLADVNNFLNLHPYIFDKLNYWQTPREFALHDGDCKDYSIAKYFSLKYLGWDTEDLRVVVVQDLNLRVAHAVLAVYINGAIMILDNQARQIVRADSIRHYQPYYSINESSWWLHKPS